MNFSTPYRNLDHQLNLIDNQIMKVVADLGRLSSYSQAGDELLIRNRQEKISFLRHLREQRDQILHLTGNNYKTAV